MSMSELLLRFLPIFTATVRVIVRGNKPTFEIVNLVYGALYV